MLSHNDNTVESGLTGINPSCESISEYQALAWLMMARAMLLRERWTMAIGVGGGADPLELSAEDADPSHKFARENFFW